MALAVSLLWSFSQWCSADDDLQRSVVVDAYLEMRTQAGRGYPVFYIAERGETVYLL